MTLSCPADVYQAMGRPVDASGSQVVVLSLACKDCGTEFASPVQVGREVFTGMMVENCLVRCPLCHFARRYQKNDFYFVEPNGHQKRGWIPEEERIPGTRPHQGWRLA